MPRAYTFEQLSPRELEFLGSDIIQRRIGAESGQPIFFKSFPEGRDGGIDAIVEDESEKKFLCLAQNSVVAGLARSGIR